MYEKHTSREQFCYTICMRRKDDLQWTNANSEWPVSAKCHEMYTGVSERSSVRLTYVVGVYIPVLLYCSVGNWQDDMRNGMGKYYYINGDVYDGHWKDHARDGKGNYTYAANGVVYTGIWERGRRTGSGSVAIMSRDALHKGVCCFFFGVSFVLLRQRFALDSLNSFVLQLRPVDSRCPSGQRACLQR